jgi:SAM-dependent methyltransferase
MILPSYVFDNDSPHAPDQHTLLSRLLDPITTDRLRRLGAGPGHHCLEVGAGAGTVANWLADRIRPGGSVLATDINVRHLTGLDRAGRPNLSVVQHDITSNRLPAGAFDLIHARLVLLHLPQRHAVLRRLLIALKPGGTLLLDEFDCGYAPILRLPPDADPAVFPRFNQAFIDHLSSAGADPRWGRHAPAALAAAGYTQIDVEIYLDPWPAGSAGCELHHSNSLHLRDGLHRHGATEADLSTLRTQLRTPGFMIASYPLYSVSGRRPAGRGG